jgi:hypothetical protein
MKVQQKGHTTIIKDTSDDLEGFVVHLTREYEQLKQYNFIIDISHYKGLNSKDLAIFLPSFKSCKKNKKSFVIVIEDFDFNKAPTSFTVVPSLLEAQDIIEMEEIERDLDF